MKYVPNLIRDSLIVCGAVSLIAGAWMAWRPLGLIVAGVILAGGSLLWEFHERACEAQRRAEEEREQRLGL